MDALGAHVRRRRGELGRPSRRVGDQGLQVRVAEAERAGGRVGGEADVDVDEAGVALHGRGGVVDAEHGGDGQRLGDQRARPVEPGLPVRGVDVGQVVGGPDPGGGLQEGEVRGQHLLQEDDGGDGGVEEGGEVGQGGGHAVAGEGEHEVDVP